MIDSRADEVRNYLAGEGHEVREFPRPTPSSRAAAEAIGCTVAQIAKSILMLVGQQPVLVITSGDTRVKSSRLKQATGLKGQVRLPAPDEVIRYTGYAPGAVSPFLLPDNLPVLIDDSLKRFKVVYPAAGSCNSAVALDFTGLKTLSKGQVAAVCDIQKPSEYTGG
jgi:prolyl-tRNA editing enzyme YbaK/EbsC (Cys-tRNA(Pro) deacylase)